MVRTELALSMGGNLSFTTWTIGYNDLASFAALTAAVTLLENPEGGNTTTAFNIPARGVILGIVVQPQTAFAGPAITSVTVSMGWTGGGAATLTPAFNIFQAVAANTYQATNLFAPPGQTTANSLVANFTAIGANLSVLTAGSVDITICYTNVTGPIPAI